MKSLLEVDITLDQVLAMVKQLPVNEKALLSKELEKDAIESKLSKLLGTVETDELSLDTINEESEIVRQQIYES
ncbi:type II toxin-antitoxin system VapB15 family antitoxin [Dyadobacter frigoris]|uniref:Uncharacterized protein n=1 Tax=Dyadobacter frigoris TaxID=2576211 RepID=A0A4U6DAY3_9BACT|nr:hypothetical protein [Dyadobacter frigoris]TKT93487.1 hypothetical protein FDK13_06460 [Dyadobacter frigoris]GLU55787.1 hypothetical protein Dfri01_52480 [Dyadobacter frigoris]